jgi:ferredoxin
LCAGVCPVAAIQIPKFSEDAFRGLLTAIDSSSAPRKTLVLTCDERGMAPEPWMVVEEVPQVGVVGLRYLALAANTSIGAVIVYCRDGLCAGKDNAKQAISLISSITGESGPVLCYFEGETGSTKIGEVHRSARKRETSGSPTFGPWKDYAHSLKSIAKDDVQAAGFGLTDMKVDSSCTLCNACVEGCPHRALAIQEGELAFQPEECTGCGFCEKICPEHSITLPEMTGTMTLSTRMVYRDEMVRCAECNAPFASAGMLKKISETLKINQTTMTLCPSCRQKEIHDQLLNKTRNVPSNSAWSA